MTKELRETFGGDEYVHRFDYDDGFTVVHMCKLTESYTLFIFLMSVATLSAGNRHLWV